MTIDPFPNSPADQNQANQIGSRTSSSANSITFRPEGTLGSGLGGRLIRAKRGQAGIARRRILEPISVLLLRLRFVQSYHTFEAFEAHQRYGGSANPLCKRKTKRKRKDWRR